jgi:homoserine kinase type II
MAVHTVLEQAELAAWVDRLGLGRLERARGVSAGIENSTYFLTIARGDEPPCEYVLTIAEKQEWRAVEFIAQLTQTLAAHGLPVPPPVADPAGTTVFTLRGKPALLVPKIDGTHPEAPNAVQCAAVGAALGTLHRTTLASPLHHTSHRDLNWMATTAQQLLPHLPSDDATLLRGELARLQRLQATPDLPRAVIHGDLFRDNTLFQGDRLTAIIDFFMAGDGYLLLDLAIAVNDWCSLPGGALDLNRTGPLLTGYEGVRPFTASEQRCWPDFLCLAATRFWVSRLQEQLFPGGRAAGAIVTAKDPEPCRLMLLHRRAAASRPHTLPKTEG